MVSVIYRKCHLDSVCNHFIGNLSSMVYCKGFIYAEGPKNALKKSGDVKRDEKRPPEGEICKYEAQY